MILKRIIALFFAIIMSIGCSFGKTEFIFPVTVQGAVFGGNTDDEIPLNLKFDSKWITKASNHIYNSNLAAFSAILCADSYFRTKDLERGTPNRVLTDDSRDNYSQSALLENLGYTDVRFIETYKQKQYSSDTNDSATFIIGYRNIDDRYDSYIIVIRGCFSIGERLSIFDIGSDSESYTALTGEHSEWTDRGCFKGLDIAVSRTEDFISSYMEEHDSESRDDTVLLTGHSRGAALANIIGADFEDDKKIKSYTYTFNAMPVTTDCKAKSYCTIFNLFDKNDYYINPLPFADEHFVRYGRDISADISKCCVVQKKISDFKGRNDYACLTPSVKKEYDILFGERFPDRKSLYEMKTAVESFDTYEAASARLEELKAYIAGLAVSDFCKVSEITESNGKYIIKTDYCGAALLYGFAQIQAYGDSAYGAVVSLFKDDAAGCRIAEIIMDNLPLISGGHLIINGYAMSTALSF